jgi:hypothetical protein
MRPQIRFANPYRSGGFPIRSCRDVIPPLVRAQTPQFSGSRREAAVRGAATGSGPTEGAKLDSRGRIAQLGERQLDKLEVTGSSPVAPTFRTREARAFVGLVRLSGSR